jgi:hypothetical protein
MTTKQRKKIARKKVKSLSESERKAWLASIASCARTARVSRQATGERWGGSIPEVAGDYPTSTMTREEFWRRTDLL